MTAVDELVAFVRAALDAKEREARAFLERSGTSLLPQRLYREQLAEVEAKRRILDLHPQGTHTPGGTAYTYCEACHMDDGVIYGDGGPCETVRLLAQPYAGQPGWREEWRA